MGSGGGASECLREKEIPDLKSRKAGKDIAIQKKSRRKGTKQKHDEKVKK